MQESPSARGVFTGNDSVLPPELEAQGAAHQPFLAAGFHLQSYFSCGFCNIVDKNAASHCCKLGRDSNVWGFSHLRKGWGSWRLRRLRRGLLKHKNIWRENQVTLQVAQWQDQRFPLNIRKHFLMWGQPRSGAGCHKRCGISLFPWRFSNAIWTRQPAQGDLAWGGSWTRRHPEISANLNSHTNCSKWSPVLQFLLLILCFFT